jgi:hypothetical protein
MFNLFNRKKEAGTNVKDIIWISTEAKWKGLVELWKKNNDTVFIFWFDESLWQAEQSLAPHPTADMNFTAAREVHRHLTENRPVVFAEHFPLKKKEQELFKDLGLEEVKVLSALDEPLFKKFGSDKIIQMMKQLGMNETESIQHSMITNAIQNAQEKIEKKLTIEQTAHSQNEWIEKNVNP